MNLIEHMERIFLSIIPLLLVNALLHISEPQSLYANDHYDSSIEELQSTWQFYNEQRLYLKAIKEKCPEMALEAEKAQTEFDLVFRSAYESIKTAVKDNFKEKFGKQWESIEPHIEKKNPAYISHPISKEGAANYIKLVKMRTKGHHIESPILETLLMHMPEFQNDPAEEFRQGFTKTYRTKGNPIAKGIDLEFQYPSSWSKSRNSSNLEPNVALQVIQSKNGQGGDLISLMVEEATTSQNSMLNEKEFNEFYTIEYLQNNLMLENTKILNSRVIETVNQKRWLIIYDYQNPGNTKSKHRSLEIVTIYKNKYIFLKCATGISNENNELLKYKFDKMKPLFELIVNSLVIYN